MVCQGRQSGHRCGDLSLQALVDSVYLKSYVSFLGIRRHVCIFNFFPQFANSSGVQLIKLVALPQCQEGLQGCTGAGCV